MAKKNFKILFEGFFIGKKLFFCFLSCFNCYSEKIRKNTVILLETLPHANVS